MMSEKKTGLISGFAWRFAERCGAQGVTFVVSIVLARLLDPDVYGSIALITVFTSLLQVFVDSGLGNALIQKKDADALDFSTVFYANVTACLILYLCMFLAAPWIAGFYRQPELTPVIRVMSLTLVISGVKNVQQAYVSQHMLFKRFFFATLGGTITAAVVGIWMAWRGWGIWALVVQNLVNQTMDTVILWLTVKWRPQWRFSFQRLKGLFGYGWKLLASALLDKLWQEANQLIIGKKYSSADLAFYNKGKQFPELGASNITASIDSVLLPAMSNIQENRDAVKKMTRHAISFSSFVLWPLMIGLAACAEPFVRLLLTDKWLDCVPYLRIFCVVYAFYPIHTANLNAIKALGRSDLFLKLEILKKTINLAILLVSMWFGPMVMAYSALLGSVISQIINSSPNKKLLGYSYGEQIRDILPCILLSLFMGAAVYCVSLLGLSAGATLLVQVPLGVALYTLGAKALNMESLTYLKNTIREKLGH